MNSVILKSTRVMLAVAAVAPLAACSLSGSDLDPPPPLYVYKYQQLWLTPYDRERAQCWNGAALICAGGLGRLSELFCQCPLNEFY